MGKHAEQLAVIADILDEIFDDNHDYVHFDFVLQRTGSGVRFNVYTPTINHNYFNNFKDFHAFLISLKYNGDNSVRRKVLHKALDEALKTKKFTENTIIEISSELSGLE